jgi:hypothetical protein
MFLKMSAQASTAIGDHGLWRVVAVPAIEIEFAGGRSYRNPGSGVARFAGSL